VQHRLAVLLVPSFLVVVERFEEWRMAASDGRPRAVAAQ
jgi:hypothetical protein